MEYKGQGIVIKDQPSWDEHTRLGVKRVDSRVDTNLKFRNITGQDSGGVQMSKSCGQGGIGQIISKNIDGLDGGNRRVICLA